MMPGDNKSVWNESKEDVGFARLSDEISIGLVEAQTVTVTVPRVVVTR